MQMFHIHQQQFVITTHNFMVIALTGFDQIFFIDAGWSLAGIAFAQVPFWFLKELFFAEGNTFIQVRVN